MLRRLALTVAGAIGLAGVSVSPVLAASPPSPYTNGELVQFQGQPQVYQVRSTSSGLALGWRSSAADFRSAGFQWSQVHVLPNGIPRPTDKYWLASGYGGGPENSTSTPWNARGIPAPASIPVTESMPGSGLIRYPGQSAIYLITKESQGRDFRVR